MFPPSLRSAWKAKSISGSRLEVQVLNLAPAWTQLDHISLRLPSVKASDFASDFSPGQIPLFSLPARVGGPGFTFIHDKRDNPLESTKGDYFTLDALRLQLLRLLARKRQDFSRHELPASSTLAKNSTYYAFGGKGTQAPICIRPLNQHRSRAATAAHGSCHPVPAHSMQPARHLPGHLDLFPCRTIFRRRRQLPSRFRVKSGRTSRSDSGFPVGGTALVRKQLELRLPRTACLIFGEGFGFAIFHDMGNVFTAGHDMIKGLLRWHQPEPGQCLPLEQRPPPAYLLQ